MRRSKLLWSLVILFGFALGLWVYADYKCNVVEYYDKGPGCIVETVPLHQFGNPTWLTVIWHLIPPMLTVIILVAILYFLIEGRKHERA